MAFNPSRGPSADGISSADSSDARGQEYYDGEDGFVNYLGRFVLGESSMKRKAWELLVLVMLLYIALWFPYSLAFKFFRLRSDPDIPCGEPYEEPTYMTVWEWVVFVFFWADLFLNFFMTYRTTDSGKTEVFDIRKIAANYLRFFFWINLLACMPGVAFQPILEALPTDPGGCAEAAAAATTAGDGDVDALSANTVGRLLRLQRASRLARLARLVRIVKVGSIIKTVSQQGSLRYLNISRGVRAVNWIVGLMWVVHLLACGWYLVAAMHTDHQLTWVAHRGLLEEPEGVQWNHAMYFILTVFTTVGFGDIYARTVGEIFYTGVVMIVGAVVHSIVMGEVIILVISADGPTMWKREQIQLLESYGDHTSLPKETLGGLQEFVKHLDMRGGNYNRDQMYNFLTSVAIPRTLLGELPGQLFNRLLLNNKLVAACARSCPGGEVPPRFPLLLSTLLSVQAFAAEDVLYQTHDFANHIYLVMDGIFSYVGEVDFERNVSHTCSKHVALTTRLSMRRARTLNSFGKQLWVNPPEGRRLYSSREAGHSSSMLEQNYGAWTPKPSSGEPWLQVDLGAVKKVKGIVMQGHPREDQWVKKYKVQHSLLEEGPWVEIEDVFAGCADRNTESQAEFRPVPARFVRVLPVEWHVKISARVGVSAVAPIVYSYRVFNKMDFFGEEALLWSSQGTQMRHATARCDVAGEALVLHKRDLLQNGGGANLLAEFPEFQRALRVECARRCASGSRTLQWFAEDTERCRFAAAGGFLHDERACGAANYAAYVLQVAWRRFSEVKRQGSTFTEAPSEVKLAARGGEKPLAPPADFESRFVSLLEGLAAEVKEVKTQLALFTDGECAPGRP